MFLHIPEKNVDSDVGKIAYLNRELSLWEVHRSLLGLLQLQLLLVLGKTSADGTSLFWAEIERKVFLSLVEQTELYALVGVNDCEDLGNRLSDVVAILNIWLVSKFLILHPNLHMMVLQAEIMIETTHILVSLAADPPAIFWVLNWPSSVFNSPSCFARSALFLDQSWPVLTFPDD